MTNKKMLFILNPENKTHRILRRGIVVGVLTFLSVIGFGVMNTNPEMVPLLTAVLAIIDKAISEAKKEE